MRRLLIVVGAALALSGCDKIQELSGGAASSSNGRYQIVAMPSGYNQVGASALLLDTRDGEVWRYYDSPPVGGGPGGTGIVSMGHLTGGTAPGTTVGGYKFGGPASAPAAQPNDAGK